MSHGLHSGCNVYSQGEVGEEHQDEGPECCVLGAEPHVGNKMVQVLRRLEAKIKKTLHNLQCTPPPSPCPILHEFIPHL